MMRTRTMLAISSLVAGLVFAASVAFAGPGELPTPTCSTPEASATNVAGDITITVSVFVEGCE